MTTDKISGLRPSLWLQGAALSTFILAGTAWQNPARAQATNLVTDGTFLTTALTDGGFICQNGANVGSTCTSNLTQMVGNTAMTVWQATCSSNGCSGTNTPGSVLFGGATDVDVSAWNGGFGLYPTVLNPPNGGNVLAVDGDPNYTQTISQMVTGLTVGQGYLLTFYQGAGQQDGLSGATTEKWQVSLGGTTQTSATMYNASQGVVGWNEVHFDFVATSTSELLSFVALGTPSGEPPVVLLSDVSLEVPEPASRALLGASAVGLLMWRRRRTARAA